MEKKITIDSRFITDFDKYTQLRHKYNIAF